MGLFDGAGERGQCGNGSTADLAALTGWPVILVLDVAAQAETAAAVALGCKTYRDDITIAGVILNRVGSDRHEQLVTAGDGALAACRCSARSSAASDIALPERHLGLVQASETGGLDVRLDRIADAVENAVRIDDVIAGRGARASGAAEAQCRR